MNRPTRLLAIVVLAGAFLAGVAGVSQAEVKMQKTSYEGYNFFLYIPARYSDDNPAGIHLFFHGQGGGGGASNFSQWGPLCEKYNLIGINMQYTDGDNLKNTVGKVNAAVEALDFVRENYKIIPGRGMIASFSGGGLPHSKLYKRTQQSWQFNHTSLYGSNYWTSVRGLPPMSWLVGLGTGEWGMGMPKLGDTQPARASELFGVAMKGGCPDVYFRIEKGKGHAISAQDVAASGEAFERSDLAFCTFIYEPDYPERELLPIAKAANAQMLSRAKKMVANLLEKQPEEAIKQKAEQLGKKIDDRIAKIKDMTERLSTQYPVLCNFYGRIFLKQLDGLPEEDEVQELIKTMLDKEENKNTLKAYSLFVRYIARGAGKFFPSNSQPELNPSAVRFLEQVDEYSVDTSLVGKMAKEYLALKE